MNTTTQFQMTPPKQKNNDPYKTPMGEARAPEDAVAPNAPKRVKKYFLVQNLFDSNSKENLFPFPKWEDKK